ncbi:MAG: M24 family metallopeptidase [Gammaproteobacteria bacterium]|nr:M24 family metallopeptidase [Gammaproteobacteria bacterium]
MNAGVGFDLGLLRRAALLHRDRATDILRRERLEALLVADPANVYYLTNHWPLLARMGAQGTAYAVLSADPAAPVALVMGQFSYYYTAVEDQLPAHVQPFLYTAPAPDVAAAAATMFRIVDAQRLPEREIRRRAAAEAAAPYARDAVAAVGSALRALAIRSGAIGVDGALAADALAAALPLAAARPAEDTLRRIRRVKSPVEVQLMRCAAERNAAAALAAARAARELGSSRALRLRYYAEAAALGLRPVFMVVDGVSSEWHDEPLRDGQALLIDCVASLGNYHGDYARTIVLGEPSARMRVATRAIATCWEEIRAALRPGLRYSDIRSLGETILRQHGFDVTIAFTPHSVGLWHRDEPQRDLDGHPCDPVVDEGMVLSVDCPLFDQGAGGTAHLEDLVLITARGAELLNSPENRTIVV